MKDNKVVIELELVPAELEDIRNYKERVLLPDGTYKTIYERRYNLPFWLRSFETNEIEPRCYFLSDCSTPEYINTFLKAGRMYIHKDHKRS